MAAIMSCPEVRASRAVLSGRWSSRDLLVCVVGEGISCQHQGGKGGAKEREGDGREEEGEGREEGGGGKRREGGAKEGGGGRERWEKEMRGLYM